MKGVSDFLSAGRVAGRYPWSAPPPGMAGMGVISVVGAFEQRSVARLLHALVGNARLPPSAR